MDPVYVCDKICVEENSSVPRIVRFVKHSYYQPPSNINHRIIIDAYVYTCVDVYVPPTWKVPLTFFRVRTQVNAPFASQWDEARTIDADPPDEVQHAGCTNETRRTKIQIGRKRERKKRRSDNELERSTFLFLFLFFFNILAKRGEECSRRKGEEMPMTKSSTWSPRFTRCFPYTPSDFFF